MSKAFEELTREEQLDFVKYALDGGAIEIYTRGKWH